MNQLVLSENSLTSIPMDYHHVLLKQLSVVVSPIFRETQLSPRWKTARSWLQDGTIQFCLLIYQTKSIHHMGDHTMWVDLHSWATFFTASGFYFGTYFKAWARHRACKDGPKWLSSWDKGRNGVGETLKYEEGRLWWGLPCTKTFFITYISA